MAIAITFFTVICTILLVNSQVIFEEDVPPRRQQHPGNNNNVIVISFERPNQNSGFQRPQQNQNSGFQRPQQNQNQQQQHQPPFQVQVGFGRPQQSFSSSSSSSSSSSFGSPQQQGNQGFFQGSNSNNNNFQQQQSGFQNQNEVVVERSCSCVRLNACGRLTREIQNKSPTTVARILGRSICGFAGIMPKVCCPNSRAQPFPNTTPIPNKHNNFGNNGNVGIVGDNNNGANGNPGFNKNPFGNGNNNDGGGLIIIPPSSTTTTTTTTQPPIQLITEPPVKKPGGNSEGGLIIGDGPIALLPPQKGGENLGYSDKGLPDDCGFSNASHTRIVGGKIAEKGAWPWIAALGYKDQAGNVNYLCGGALISQNFLVTASHCLHGRDDLASIRLGDHDLYSTEDGVTPLEVEVDKKILHPNYDPATFKNDIALLHLKNPVPFSRQIHPICLPSTPQLRNQRFENTSPFVAGWGAIQFNGPSSSALREVQIPTVPDSVCQEKYSSFKTAVVDDTNLCAGLQTGGKDACQGDSGGPLQQPVGTNRYVLIGVVSFGFKCAEPNFPGVYTRVTSHLDWIQSVINQP